MSACGCCACLSAGPHLAVANRPGLEALRYRIGTHPDFLEAMIRRLTIPASGEIDPYSLHALTTRESDDPSIAFLDAWATVADVLTFYQERIANEGFLRTATERRSILELGQLVGYTLKPGVSSSVYLAYTVDDATKTVIPAGSKAQSIPGADEQPQTFETSEDIEARGVWNAIKPRLSEPQDITVDNVLYLESVWVKGTSARISAGDPLLFTFLSGDETVHALRRAVKGTIDSAHDRTEVLLEPVRPFYQSLYEKTKIELSQAPAAPLNALEAEVEVKAKSKSKKKKKAADATLAAAISPRFAAIRTILEQVLLLTPRRQLRMIADRILGDGDEFYDAVVAPEEDATPTQTSTPQWSVNRIVRQLAAPRGIAPKSQWQFARSLNVSLGSSSDFLPRLVSSFVPSLGTNLHAAIANATTGAIPYAELQSLHVLRRRANVFGYNAPTALFEERPEDDDKLPTPKNVTEHDSVVHLDGAAESIRAGSYVVVQRRDGMTDLDNIAPTSVRTVHYTETVPRTAYTISARSTALTLNAPWAMFTKSEDNLLFIRNTSILAESEELTLAQVPVTRPIGQPIPEGGANEEGPARINLDAVVEGLQPGRWLIVSGERVDIPGTTGTIASELVMISAIELHPQAGAGGTPYSTLVLAPEGLKYEYRRATVTIYGNVVKATHGETRTQILGSGDGSQALQTFKLQQTPLTFVSAPTVTGVVSTLAVRVNDVLWHESDSFFGTTPGDRVFVTRIADSGKVSLTFGNGREGSRLPAGPDNVRAVYRSGIGKPGNVRARQVATAISRPLGVKDVINPLPASGGADPESRNDARRNIPVSLQAMGRIVSVRDYSDFARTFAGVNKAVADVITDGRRRIVHLTVGGAGDIEIDVHSDLYRNLVEALRAFGDPYQPFVVAAREKVVIAGTARVRVHPDYLWSSVGPKIQAALLDRLSYDRRDFGQVVFPAEIVAAIQNVEGVAFVDLDTLGAIEQAQLLDPEHDLSEFGVPDIQGINPVVPKRARIESGALLPAQIAYLPPELADLFVLTEIPNEE
jgi:hypothetical protein